MKILPLAGKEGGKEIPALHAPRVLLSAHAFNPGLSILGSSESPVNRLLKHTTLLKGRREKKWRNIKIYIYICYGDFSPFRASGNVCCVDSMSNV